MLHRQSYERSCAIMDNVLIHKGVKRKSGRYPWGSGENPYQHEAWFLDQVKNLRAKGLTDKDIAKGMGLTTDQFKSEITLAKAAEREGIRTKCLDLQNQGLGATEIGRRLGISESSVRSYLDPALHKNTELLNATINVLKKNVDEKKYIDVGYGVASDLGINDTRLKAAIRALENNGYETHTIQIPQASNKQQKTTLKVLTKPGTTKKELYEHVGDIGLINEHFVDPNSTELHSYRPVEYISSKRIEVANRETGGAEKDGLIEIRRGVEGLDLGNSHYAQVRIGVDGTHYIKGVAVYSDDLPKGVDIRVNSSKEAGLDKLDYLKKVKTEDPNNPFGSYIKKGGQRGYLNIVKEEGDLDTWSRTLSSQFLSKQSTKLAERQLSIHREDMQRTYDEIMALTNPTLKKHLLAQFADKCDNAAVVLKAAALPQQANKTIIPINSLKPNEIFAPGYDNGTNVVLIRHPHGGTFEIPELKVNNRNKEGLKVLGSSIRDAIGIHHSVAERLSGADFDGDTVIIIPNNDKRIKSSPALKGLRDFDPHMQYKKYDGMKVIEEGHMQKQMGEVSNLITDMTLQGGADNLTDICNAVKYSMVIIDARKHELNYKQAYKDFNIAALKKKYQSGGASTLISRAKSPVRDIPERKQWNLSAKSIDAQGNKIYVETGRKKRVREEDPDTGKVTWRVTDEPALTSSRKMAETKDARTLMSKDKTVMEVIYADYANSMKALANNARKAYVSVKDIPYSPEARAEYRDAYESLKTKVAIAKSYSPLERKAQATTNAIIKAMTADEPELWADKDRLGKTKAMVLADQRAKYGGTRQKFEITDREWEAIQKGGITKTTLEAVLKYTDQDKLKERAMPKTMIGMTPAKVALAKSRLSAGYTQKEVADLLGVSVNTLKKAVYS